jgi:hypothetical protein
MNILTAIEKATVGQKIKRRNPSTVNFFKRNLEVVKLDNADYEATDWVLVIPKKDAVTTVQDLAKKAKDGTLNTGDKVTLILSGKKLTGSVKTIVR